MRTSSAPAGRSDAAQAQLLLGQSHPRERRQFPVEYLEFPAPRVRMERIPAPVGSAGGRRRRGFDRAARACPRARAAGFRRGPRQPSTVLRRQREARHPEPAERPEGRPASVSPRAAGDRDARDARDGARDRVRATGDGGTDGARRPPGVTSGGVALARLVARSGAACSDLHPPAPGAGAAQREGDDLLLDHSPPRCRRRLQRPQRRAGGNGRAPDQDGREHPDRAGDPVRARVGAHLRQRRAQRRDDDGTIGHRLDDQGKQSGARQGRNRRLAQRPLRRPARRRRRARRLRAARRPAGSSHAASRGHSPDQHVAGLQLLRRRR